MKGTPKQTAWAEAIRADLLAAWEELEKQHGAAPEKVREYVRKHVLDRDEAKYYIDGWGRWYKLAGKPTASDLEKLLANLEGEVGDAAWEWLYA